MGRTSRRIVPGLLVALLGACGDIPRDPDGTLEDARNGVLRVGVAEAPPWVVRAGPDSAGAVGAGGPEPALIRSFAAALGARVEWVWGGAEELLVELERGELAVVAAGLTRESPWAARVALTRPHARAADGEHVLATAPGENALLVALERHMRRDP